MTRYTLVRFVVGTGLVAIGYGLATPAVAHDETECPPCEACECKCIASEVDTAAVEEALEAIKAAKAPPGDEAQ